MTFKAGSHRFGRAFLEALRSCQFLALAGAVAAVVVQAASFWSRRGWFNNLDFPKFGTRELLPKGIELYPYAQALFALAAALLVFGFLFSKRHAHSKFALPMKRQTIFTARFLAGALCSVVPPVVAALTTLACHTRLPASEAMHMSLFWRLLGNMTMQALLCYAIAVFACLMAGSWIKAIVNGAALLAAPGLALLGLYRLMAIFLPGYGHIINPHYNSYAAPNTPAFYLQNPVSFLAGKLDQLNTYAGPKHWFTGRDLSIDFVTPAVALALTAALFFLSYRTFVRYPAENAGQPEIGRRFTRWLAAPLSLGVLAFCLESAVAGAFAINFQSVPGMLALGALISVALYFLLAVVFRLWDKKIARMLPSLLCALLLPLAAAGICKFCFPSYAGRAPEPAQVRSVAVSYRGLHALRELERGQGWSSGHYFEPSSELLLVSEADIARVLELQQSLAAQQRQMGESFRMDNRVDIIYTLRDGKQVNRRFWHMDAACLEALLKLDETDGFDEMLRHTLSLPAKLASADENADFSSFFMLPPQAKTAGTIYLMLPDGRFVWPQLSESQKQTLMQTLYEELSAQTPQQRYFPETQETVMLCIPLGDTNGSSYGEGDWWVQNEFSGASYTGLELTLALYPEQFSRTLKILQEANIDLSLNTEFVRAAGIPAPVYLQKNMSFDYSLPPAVFYATNEFIEISPFAFTPEITAHQINVTGSDALEALFKDSTTQTSFAREGYLVWFIRADGNTVCRFVEKATFESLTKQA